MARVVLHRNSFAGRVLQAVFIEKCERNPSTGLGFSQKTGRATNIHFLIPFFFVKNKSNSGHSDITQMSAFSPDRQQFRLERAGASSASFRDQSLELFHTLWRPKQESLSSHFLAPILPAVSTPTPSSLQTHAHTHPAGPNDDRSAQIFTSVEIYSDSAHGSLSVLFFNASLRVGPRTCGQTVIIALLKDPSEPICHLNTSRCYRPRGNKFMVVRGLV